MKEENAKSELQSKPTPKKIFISYGHDEYETLAKKIKEDLEVFGHEVWFDRSNLKAGRDWEISIENGLKGTQVVLVMMTPYSMRRPDGYCLNELSMACTLRKEIIPVMVKDCIPPLSIHRIQWLDFKEWPNIFEKKYKEKFAHIRDVIEGKILSFEGNHNFLINKLKPIDFKAEIEEHVRRFFGREWIFEKIKEWLYGDPESRVFFLTGKPGVGKTAISSMLCRKFPEVKAYHLVKYGDTRKSDAIECVFSLAYQLSTQISEYADKLLMIDLEGIREKNATTIFDELIVQPLFDLTPPSKPALIVIDALDEAKKGDDNLFVSFIADSFKLVPQWLKLFITSRPERDILNSLSSIKPYPLDTEDVRNTANIKGYLQLKLNELFPSKIINKALEIILERSEGIFLYVSEVLNELKLGRLDLDHPEKFPKGLTQVYTIYFKRQFPKEKDYNEHQRPLLELITAAREPLDIKMVYDILKWDDYRKKLSIDPLSSFLEIVDGKISLFHKSIIEWLSHDQTDIRFYVSSKKGHEYLANQGWKIYESDINDLSLYSLNHLPLHLLQLEEWDKIEKLLSDLRYIERCCTEDLIHNLIRNYLDVLSSEELPNDNRNIILKFQKFVVNQANVLQKYPQITIQQAFNQPDESIVSQAANDIVKFTNFSQPWIEWINKPKVRDPDNTIIESAQRDKTSELWEAEESSEIRVVSWHAQWVNKCAFSPDGIKLVSASRDNTLKLWNVETGAELRTFTGHTNGVTACAFLPDGRKVVSASYDRTLKLWDVDTGAVIRTVSSDAGWGSHCAFSPDGTKMVSAFRDKILMLWNVETGTEIRTFSVDSDGIHGCAFSPDGTKIAVASKSGYLTVLGIESGVKINSIGVHPNYVDYTLPDYYPVKGCAFSPDSTKVVTSSENLLMLWDVLIGNEQYIITQHPDSVPVFAFLPDGTKVVSPSYDKTLKLWDVETEVELFTFPILGSGFSVAVGVNGLIAAGDSFGVVYILRLHNVPQI